MSCNYPWSYLFIDFRMTKEEVERNPARKGIYAPPFLHPMTCTSRATNEREAGPANGDTYVLCSWRSTACQPDSLVKIFNLVERSLTAHAMVPHALRIRLRLLHYDLCRLQPIAPSNSPTFCLFSHLLSISPGRMDWGGTCIKANKARRH